MWGNGRFWEVGGSFWSEYLGDTRCIRQKGCEKYVQSIWSLSVGKVEMREKWEFDGSGKKLRWVCDSYVYICRSKVKKVLRRVRVVIRHNSDRFLSSYSLRQLWKLLDIKWMEEKTGTHVKQTRWMRKLKRKKGCARKCCQDTCDVRLLVGCLGEPGWLLVPTC